MRTIWKRVELDKPTTFIKKSYSTFKHKNKEKESPFYATSYYHANKKGEIKIGSSIFNPDDVMIISDEQYVEMKQYWDSITLSNQEIGGLYACLRRSTLELKLRYPGFTTQVKERVFAHNMKNNTRVFEAYHCSLCDSVHIGKNIESKMSIWNWILYPFHYLYYLKLNKRFKKK